MIRDREADRNIVSPSTQLDLAAVGSLPLYHGVKVRSLWLTAALLAAKAPP